MRQVHLAAAVVAGSFLMACASVPPTADIAQAEVAVKEAQKEGAAQSSPLALRMAQDKLRLARELADKGEMVGSRRNAQQAEVDALVAAAEARRNEASEALEALEASVRTLEEEIQHDAR
jgi:multidrug resistance efflux pump